MERKIRAKSECDEEAEQFLDWQREFNETGDRELLFFKMVPYMERTIRSCLVAFTRGHAMDDAYDTAAIDGALMIAKRYVSGYKNGKLYSKDYPKTMCWWTAKAIVLRMSDRYFPRAEYDKVHLEDLDKDYIYRRNKNELEANE